jgi:hypothetical protein
MTDAKPSFSEYHRQGMVCLTLAQLSDMPDVQAHWHKIAQNWFKLAQNADGVPQQTASQIASAKVVPLKR